MAEGGSSLRLEASVRLHARRLGGCSDLRLAAAVPSGLVEFGWSLRNLILDSCFSRIRQTCGAADENSEDDPRKDRKSTLAVSTFDWAGGS